MAQIRTLIVHFRNSVSNVRADRLINEVARVTEKDHAIEHTVLPQLDGTEFRCTACKMATSPEYLNTVMLRDALRPEYNRLCYRIYRATGTTDTDLAQRIVGYQHAEFKRLVQFLGRKTPTPIYDDVDLAMPYMHERGRGIAAHARQHQKVTEKEIASLVETYT